MKTRYSLLIVLIAFVLVGCGGLYTGGGEVSVDEPVEEKQAGDITIGLSVSTLNNPFFGALRDGVVETAEANGSQVQVLDAQDDSATQSNDIDDLIQQNVDILLINPVDSSAIQSAVEAANAAQIPVITIDRSTDGGSILSYIASNNVDGGEMAAEYIVELLGEGANVVQLEGVPGTSAANERGEGFENIANEKLNVLDSQSANFNRAEGLSVMEDMLQSHSEIQAVFAQNDEMALGALEAIESAGKDIVVVGFDGNEDAVSAVEKGQLSGTVAQKPYAMGKIAVETVYKFFSGETIEEQIDSPLELIK